MCECVHTYFTWLTRSISHAPNRGWKSQQELSNFTSIRRLNRNIDSVHQYFGPSPFALFLGETHNPFIEYHRPSISQIHHSLFFCSQSRCLRFCLATCQVYQILTFPVPNFTSCDGDIDCHPPTITFILSSLQQCWPLHFRFIIFEDKTSFVSDHTSRATITTVSG